MVSDQRTATEFPLDNSTLLVRGKKLPERPTFTCTDELRYSMLPLNPIKRPFIDIHKKSY